MWMGRIVVWGHFVTTSPLPSCLKAHVQADPPSSSLAPLVPGVTGGRRAACMSAIPLAWCDIMVCLVRRGSASLISAGVCSLSLAAGFRFGCCAPSVASPWWNSLRSGPPGTTSHHGRFGKLLLGLRISCAFLSRYVIICVSLEKEICCGCMGSQAQLWVYIVGHERMQNV